MEDDSREGVEVRVTSAQGDVLYILTHEDMIVVSKTRGVAKFRILNLIKLVGREKEQLRRVSNRILVNELEVIC